jgi:hypothetical protein
MSTCMSKSQEDDSMMMCLSEELTRVEMIIVCSPNEDFGRIDTR